MKGYLLLFACLLVSGSAPGQRVIIAEDLRGDDEPRVYGMNRTHYSHSYLGVSFLAGPPEDRGAEIHYRRSWSLQYGYRYKLRISNVFSVGTELSLHRTSYRPRQTEYKQVPGPAMHDTEKLVFVQPGLSYYKRINFGQRGDYIGRFFDAGAYGAWNVHVRHISFDEIEGERVKVRRTGMDYPAAFEYGVLARVGFSNFVIRGSYRFSELFRSSADLPEFPRLMIGFEMGTHPF